MEKRTPLLGVLGGLGPMSTFYFCQLLTAHTRASRDADHVDMLVSSRATTPDRTAFILGRSTEDPLPVMLEEAERLTRAGAELLVIPCNTAHYFYDGLQKGTSLPIINIIEETVKTLSAAGIRRFGLLATEGTASSGAYERICRRYGITCVLPTKEEQDALSSLIYEEVKQNRDPSGEALEQIAASMLAHGCEKLVLGCTELSLLKPRLAHPEHFLDALEVLAFRTLLRLGKEPVGFSDPLLGESLDEPSPDRPTGAKEVKA